MSLWDWTGLALVVAGGAVAAAELIRWLQEQRTLREALVSVIPGGRIRSRDDLVALWRFVGQHVFWEPAKATESDRTLLRDTAVRTLATGVGLCGENARLSVRLLRLAGCPASRLYLFGERWGHVVAEVWWDGAWRLFDAHQDPATLPSDAEVGVLPTDDIACLPNRVAENQWVSAATAKLFRRVPALARRRIPGPFVVLVESPHLLKAAAGLVLAAIGALVLLR